MMRAAGKPVHIERMRMRWGDMDALGHMNNTVYFRFFEEARVTWMERLSLDYATHAEGPILGSIACRFRIPIIYPASLCVSMYAGKPRNSSFVLESEITDEADATRVYATSEAVMVWIDLKSGKSQPLPDWMRAHISST